MFDTAIIGSGPAGLSAALTLQARGKNFIWFGSRQLSPKIQAAEKIRNYPGLQNVSGEELCEAFHNQLDEAGIQITEKTVTGVFENSDHYAILCDQEVYHAYTVILAAGVAAVKPIAGELEFLGKGVSYCATCDGFLYKGKTIAILCTSKDLEHEIEFLAGLAEKVYLFPGYKEAAVTGTNIEIISGMPKEIRGGKKVEAVCFADRELPVDGVFMLKDAVSPGVLIKGIQEENGHVVVDRSCKTNLSGIFAAGDCTGRPYQYAKAVGEGNVAAHSAIDYLAKNGFKTVKPADRPQTLQGLIAAVDRSRLPGDAQIEKTLLTRLTENRFDLIPLNAGQKAEPGDVITFSVSGGKGRYDRENLRLTLSQGLYDADVEKVMEGAVKGDILTVGNLTVRLHEICRKSIPVMTDAMVKALQIEGVTTLEQYRKAVREELTMNEIYIIAGEILSTMYENAPDVECDGEKLDVLGDLEIDFFNRHFKETIGKSLDEMTCDEIRENLGCDSKEQFAASRREWYKIKVKQCTVFANALGVELTGEYDLYQNYEALGKLQLQIIEVIKRELVGGESYGA